jgi:hypothetical protein
LINAAALVRLITSATTPAGSVNRKNASDVTTGTRERKKDDLAREFINQTAAVLYAATALLEIKVTSQSVRNFSFLRENQILPKTR